MACKEAEAVCCHDEDYVIEGRQPMVAMMDFVLVDASANADDSVHEQPRGLLVFFRQPDYRVAHRPTNLDDQEHIPVFLISTCYVEELEAQS